MPILEDDKYTKTLNETYARIKQREKEAKKVRPQVKDGMASAKREQQDIERDASLIRETGFSNRGGSTLQYMDKDGKVEAGAGMKVTSRYAVEGSREAADMQRTADRQNRAAKTKRK